MNKSPVVLVFMFLACTVFAQDAPQTKTESASSLLSIHLAPMVSIRADTVFGDTGDVEIGAGPAVGISLIGRFPRTMVDWIARAVWRVSPCDLSRIQRLLFWLRRVCPVGSIVRYRPSVFTGSTSWSRLWPWLMAGKYPYFPAAEPVFLHLGESLDGIESLPHGALVAEIGSAMMVPNSYNMRYFLAADVGYHFSALAAPAARTQRPSPALPSLSPPNPASRNLAPPSLNASGNLPPI